MQQARDWQEDMRLMTEVFDSNLPEHVIVRYWLQEYQKKAHWEGLIEEAFLTYAQSTIGQSEYDAALKKLADRTKAYNEMKERAKAADPYT